MSSSPPPVSSSPPPVSSSSSPNSPSLTPLLRSSAPPAPSATSSDSASSNSPRANQTHLSDLFGLHEPLLADFSCALLDKIRYVGRLYVFPAHVAFSSSVFGDTKLVLPLVEVRALNRKKSVLVVPDAIELVCGEPSLPLDQCETFVFASFFNRELAFTTLERAWRAAVAPPPAAVAAAAAAPPPVPPSPTPHEVPPPAAAHGDADADTAAAKAAPLAVPVDDASTRLRASPLSHSASKRSRRPATMPSVLPSLMPENDDDALPFISTGCPHVTNSSVDEVFTSESATGSTTIQQELPNCSLAVVWHTLFKTTAFWRHVHSKNGFLDFEGSPWRARTASDSSSTSGTGASGAGDGGGAGGGVGGGGSGGSGIDAEYKPATCCVERLITFRVSLSQPVGPKSTRMTQTLVARFVTARRLVIETVSQCHDAPYADSFLVNSMLVVDEKHDGSCLLRIWWGVRFLRTVWMVKGLIESTALRDNQQFYGLWSLEALTALHERRVAAAADGDDSAVDATPRLVAEPAAKEAEEREVVQQIQHIVVGDNPPMLARSVVMSLSGVVLLWLAWWGVSALSASGAPPDDPVRQLREHVTRLEARIDTLSAALTRVAHLLPDDRREQVHTVLSTLESSEQAKAAGASFGARMLIHRAAQLSGSAEDARTVALLSDALEQLSRATPHESNWSSTTMSFVTIVVAILVSVAIALTSTTSTSTQDLQKKFETELDAYKDAIRYWHAVLTLQRPTDYGGWLVAVILVLAFLGTRDWSNGTTFFTSVFVYFAVSLGLDMFGPLPFAKFVAGKYENSEADPFVRACAVLALVEHKGRGYWQDMRELRRINNVKFTFQVCFAALIGAFICSYVSGFTFFALALIAVFAVPPIIVRQLHLQAYKVAKPHIDQIMSKVNGLINKAPAPAAAATAAADNKKQN